MQQGWKSSNTRRIKFGADKSVEQSLGPEMSRTVLIPPAPRKEPPSTPASPSTKYSMPVASIDKDIDYMPYSWFFFKKNIKSIKFLKPKEDKNIYYLNYTKENHKKRLYFWKKKRLILDIYIISACSIMKTSLFRKLTTSRDKLFLKWSKKLPFNFEKDQYDMHWLPYRIGILKRELFASIDDDLGCKGYSLISRGKYKSLKIRSKNKTIKKNKINFGYLSIIKFFLKTNINKIYRFLFF